MTVRYYCRDCDYTSEDPDFAEDHEMEYGHSVRETTVHPVLEEETE
jgi:hypothetical protein